ncbi:hypothetical protein LshimejAT787_0106870 [Lyophyllum shimeji]|uniref:Uncharacterized protein n=1 Tax=Lyophyllum shimeji TaxID=47721 RepID=A0A9P3UI12_LYOSH|nr:hypothetical protein LshimejAT787_0106870 [Lyophyllum shimeji]
MYPALVAILLWFTISVAAVPAWEAARGQTSIGSLVPGASYIEAIGASREKYRTTHLSALIPGQPGNLTVLHNARAPSLFYINRGQLWQFHNESAIYPVNVVNSTSITGFPLQLVTGKKQAGIRSGTWRWQGTVLNYDQGSRGNTGLFYSCTLEDGTSGVFMFLQPSPTPLQCERMTMHSWLRTYINGQ